MYVLDLRRCHACKFVFAARPPNIVYDAAYFAAEGVDTQADEEAAYRVEERLAAIARDAPPGQSRRLLDIGIGDGRLLSVAERLGYETAGLDVSDDAVRLARGRYRLRAELSVAPLASAFPGHRFDIIHMNEVIEHIPNPMELLEWCRAHITDGGLLVIQTGNVDSVASRLLGSRWDYLRPVHCSYFSPGSLDFALKAAGFRAIASEVTDWRLRSIWQRARRVRRTEGRRAGLRWLAFGLTCKIRWLRRTITVRARPVHA
jgi:SAM-dependent methyltransferase